MLRGRLERALETGRIDEVWHALEATDAFLHRVEKLLALARAEAGQGLRLESVALDEVVVEAVDELRPLFDAKGVALHVDVPDATVVVRGDAVALGMVVRNLLENALKFTEAGRVRVLLRVAGGEAELVVEDTGPGVPPEALPHLFERFFRAAVGLRKAGTGLGLALVMALSGGTGAMSVPKTCPKGAPASPSACPGRKRHRHKPGSPQCLSCVGAGVMTDHTQRSATPRASSAIRLQYATNSAVYRYRSTASSKSCSSTITAGSPGRLTTPSSKSRYESTLATSTAGDAMLMYSCRGFPSSENVSTTLYGLSVQ